MTTRLLMLSIMLTVSCSLAADESFKNFRIPDHYVFASAVSGKGYYDLENAGYKHGDMRDRAIYGNASGKIYWLKDSDVLRSIFSMSAGLSSDRDSYHFDNCEDGSTGEQVRSSNSHDASASWKGWFYPAQIPLGLYTEMSGSISASEYPRTHTGTWTSGNTDYAEIEDNYDKSNRRTARLDGGIVWGRVRDVTTLYRVRILEQRLMDEGVLSAALQPATLQKLAGLYYQESYYRYSFERPDRYFWRDVETVLAADPAFHKEAFDLYSFYLMNETINGHAWRVRNAGFVVGPVVSLDHSYDKSEYRYKEFTSYRSPDSTGVVNFHEGKSEYDHNSDYVSVGFKAGYYLPVNLKWQIDFISQISRVIQPEVKGYSISTSLQTTYEIADRWETQGYISHSRALRDPEDEGNQYRPYYFDTYSSWGITMQAQVKYYIESRTALSLSMHYSHFEYAEPDANINDNYSNGLQFEIGLTYHFTGVIPQYLDDYYYY